MESQINKDLINKLADKIYQYKGEKIKAIAVDGVVDYTDFVLLVTANSKSHTKGLYEVVNLFFKEQGISPYIRHKRIEERNWMICDYIDVVVHIMLKEEREYYRLDELFNSGIEIYTSG